MPLLDPRRDPVALPAPDSDPILSLEVQTGNKCLECFKILTDTKGIVKHLLPLEDKGMIIIPLYLGET